MPVPEEPAHRAQAVAGGATTERPHGTTSAPMQDVRTTGGTPSSAPLVVSILSVIIALASMAVSASNFYFSTLRPARASIAIGPQMLFSSTPQVGGWFTLANTGGQPTTITSAKMHWDVPDADFGATMTSRNLDEWYYTDKGLRKVSTTTHYSLFSPIPLVGHANASAILWFTTGARDFKFTPGGHTFTVEVFNGGMPLGKAVFAVNLSDIDIKNLDTSTDLPIDVTARD